MSASPTLFTTYDAVRGVVDLHALSTISNAQGVAGYVLNDTVPIGQNTAGPALSGTSVCAANGSNCWGIVTLTSDNTVGNTGVTDGTGKNIENEFDLNITSPNTSGTGLNIGGTALPTNVTLAFNGVAINKLWGAGGVGTGTALFSSGFIAASGCCVVGLNIGATKETGADADGMPIVLGYRDHTGTAQNLTLSAQAVNSGSIGTLILSGSGSQQNLLLPNGSLYLPSDNGVAINGNFVIHADSSSDLVVGATSGSLQLASSGAWAANGSVATTVTSLGPAGSHTTIQKWLKVKDDAGGDIYIPGY